MVLMFVANFEPSTSHGDTEVMELMLGLLMGRLILSLVNRLIDTMKHVGVGVSSVLQLCDLVTKVFELCPKLVNVLKVLLNFCDFLLDGVCFSDKGVIALVVDLLGNMVQGGGVLEDSFLQASYLSIDKGYFIILCHYFLGSLFVQ